MRLSTKIICAVLGAVVLAVSAYQGYLTVRYRLYNGYKIALSAPAASKDARQFTALEDAEPNVKNMKLAAENDVLKLYVDPVTANVAVYDKRSFQTVYAIPPDAANDPIAAELNKSLLQSQLTLDYFNEDRLPASMNSFDHAVSLGQYSLESLDDGLRCVYTMGDISGADGIVPLYITSDRLEQFLGKIAGTRDYTRNKMRYVESKTVPGHLELMESLRNAKATLREMEEILKSTGYTKEDYAEDMAGSGVEGIMPLHFVVPVEYRLDGDSVVVTVNTADIEEYSGGRIEKIQLVRGFGAGGMDEDGYLVVPNGSGSLIYFNNGKSYADEYMQELYGRDPLLSEYVTLGSKEPARIAFFGISRPDLNILGRVESGDSLAYLTAGVSGKYNAYNYIFAGFTLRGSMSLAMFGVTGSESTLPVVEKDMPAVTLSVRYSLLPEGYDGYSGMAKRAREQLEAEGELTKSTQNGDIPFYMDLVGSVMGQKFFAGISYNGQITMTRYEDAAGIVSDMSALGVVKQVVNYQGWFNRGYYHDVPDKIKPVGALGSTRVLEELSQTLEAGGGKLYSGVNFQAVTFTSRRFRYELESSRYYGGGMVAAFGQVNPITLYNTFSMGYSEVMYDILSPRFLTRYTKNYIKAFSSYPFTGTALNDLGDILASDRKRTDVIDREQAKEVVVYALDMLANEGKPLMISGGNQYALGVGKDLVNIPLSHNALYLVDEEIPFYEMLIHGYIDYAGAAINLSNAFDENEIALRLVEYGASPHFTFTAESASDMKYTGMNRMYSTTYQNWRETAAEIYKTVNSALSLVSGSTIISHEILQDGLRRVTYENGVIILINRSECAAVLDGVVLAPVSFFVKEAAA